MRTSASLLPLAAVVALLGSIVTPTFGFHALPSVGVKKHGVTKCGNFIALRYQHRSAKTLLLLLSSPDDSSKRNSQEDEMMEQASRDQEFRRVAQESGQLPPSDTSQKRMDPLIASLTRIDEPTPGNVPTTSVPLFGEVPADGTLGLLVPAAAISVLGFIFSIVVAFNSKDAIVQEMSKVELPEMKYTETVVKEGQCRGLCSSQDDDLDGLRNFMESISNSRKD